MKFVNRQAEIHYLNSYLQHDPNALLFVYGPKSSGKSLLLQQVIANLPPGRFAVNFMNLREVLIYDFTTFIDIFFPKTLYGKVKDIAEGVSFNIGFFGLNVDDEKIVQQNPFKVMGEKLRAAKARGQSPVIIIDEIQLLKHISMNSARYLIDELFNFFVSLTKTAHIAHIIAATSESYFLEEIYRSAKLKKALKLYLVDHLSQTAVTAWLKEEGMSASDIETIWHYLGGCPWEIQQLLLEREEHDTIEEACAGFVNDEYGKLIDYVFRMDAQQEKILRQVNEKIVKDGYCHIEEMPEKDTGIDVLKDMAAQDFWFYKTEDQHITANSQSIYWAFERMVNRA